MNKISIVFFTLLITLSVGVQANKYNDVSQSNKQKLISEFGVDYFAKKDNSYPTVYFQDGMTFGDKLSWKATHLLSDFMKLQLGRINIIYKAGYKERLNLNDVLMRQVYSNINSKMKSKNKNALIILFMAGVNQFLRASKVASLENEKWNNIDIIAVANEISIKDRIYLLKQSKKNNVHPFEFFFTDSLKNNLQNLQKKYEN